MPKAIAGAPYTVVFGDTLSGIAKQAYGDGRRWREIYAANETVLRSGNPNLIYPGETINIPPDAVVEAAVIELKADALPTIPDKAPDDFTILIDNIEFAAVSGRAFRAADNAADGFTAVINFEPTDADLIAALFPYKYPSAACYLGGELIIQGVLYSVEISKTETTRTATLEGWSPTVDIIDSTTKAPYEAKNITLEKRARALVEPLGIKVVFDADADEEFKRVTIDATETIFDHLSKLAVQRGILITSTELGELKFTRAASGKPVATIEEGAALGRNFTAKFDGRKRFNTYKPIAQSPGRKSAKNKQSKFQIAKDEMVPKSRQLTFTADDTTAGGMKNAAEWKRSKQLADALTMPFRVSSWYDSNNELWKENTIVTVVAPTIYIPNGFDFLIRSVEYGFKDKGTEAVLNLIPPQVFTGEKIDEPWAAPEIRQAHLIERVTAGI